MQPILNRRKFIKQITNYSLWLYSLLELGLQIIKPSPAKPPDIAWSQTGNLKELLTKTINALGSIKKFITPKSKVVIKPNFSWIRTPEVAATTNPQLVKELIKLCYAAGAREVLIIDHTIDSPDPCLRQTGMQQAVKQAGGKIIAINNESFYKVVKIPEAKRLKSAAIAKDVLNADVFINVPILKVHNQSGVTISMKNLMGIVWDRSFFHVFGLHQCIADLSLAVKPNLIILDAIKILTTQGPQGPGNTQNLNLIAAGTDPVAIDAFGTQILGINPTQIEHLTRAYQLGLGQINLNKLKITQV